MKGKYLQVTVLYFCGQWLIVFGDLNLLVALDSPQNQMLFFLQLKQESKGLR